jgi:predicted enzyme related to lactoylglutathione lyase
VSSPNFVILYVKDPAASTRFYEAALGRPPAESAPAFSMFALSPDVMLALWNQNEVTPEPTTGSAFELALPVATSAEVDDTCAKWTARGVTIVESPVDQPYGRAFLAVDPDGHRLRVFSPAAA